MAELKYTQDPTKHAVVEAARETLGELASMPDTSMVGGASPLAHQFVSDVPLAVYSLGLEPLKDGKGIANADPVAWRVFVLDQANRPVGVAEVAPAGGGMAPAFQGYTRGPQVAASGRALSDAEAQTVGGEYEPRFLEVPGINVTALWLKNVGSGEDRIVPIEPIPRFLKGQPSFTPGEFLDRVRPQAAERLRHDDRPLQSY